MQKFAIIVAAIVATLALLVVGAGVVLETRWFSGYLSGKLSDTLGREVTWDGALAIDWSLHPTVTVNQLSVENTSWAEHDSFARADEISARLALPAIMDGLLVVEQIALTQPAAHLAQSAEQGNNWNFLIPEEKKDQEPLLKPRVETVLVKEGEFTFNAPARETSVRVTVSAPDGQQLSVEGDGTLRGEPIRVQLTGGPPGKAASKVLQDTNVAKHYDVSGKIHWQDHTLTVDGHTESLTELGELQAEVTFEGPDANALAELFGVETRPVEYSFSGLVQHQSARWSLQDLDGNFGESTLSGKMAYNQQGERPSILVDLDMSAFDVGAAVPLPTGGKKMDAKKSDKSFAEQFSQATAPLRHYDADVKLHFGQLSYRDTTWQDVTAEVTLDSGQLEIRPLSFDTEGGHVELTGDLSASDSPPNGQATLSVDNVELSEAIPMVGDQAPGLVDGHLTVRLQDEAISAADSRLRYWQNNADTNVTLSIYTDKTESGQPAMAANFSGQLNGQVVDGNYFSGPILTLASNPKPIPVNANVTLGESEWHANGTLTQPLQLKDLDLKLQASAPGTDSLNNALPMTVPKFPCYRFNGQLVREDNSWYLRNIDAQFGESDVSGDVRFRIDGGERPMLWANLHSDKLRSQDLSAKSESSTEFNEGDNENDSSEESDGSSNGSDVLPEGQVFHKYLQAMNADFQYEAETLDLAGILFDKARLDLKLDNGMLQLEPLLLGSGPGNIFLQMEVDATNMPADGSLDIEVSQLGLNNLLGSFGVTDGTLGTVGGRGEFSFEGNNLADALAGLRGNLRLMMNGGQLDALIVEAIGLDAGEIMMGLIGDEPEPIDIQCAYTELGAQDGVVDVEHFTVATTDSNLRGNGKINMDKETFQFVIEANPKDFSLLAGSSPIRLHGSFKNLNIDVVSSELIGKGALATVAAAAFPPAALVPLADAGTTEGTGGCSELVASSQ